ncbi:hypothetical protein ACU8KH_03186 [Lachancea thermotolerans]
MSNPRHSATRKLRAPSAVNCQDEMDPALCAPPASFVSPMANSALHQSSNISQRETTARRFSAAA